MNIKSADISYLQESEIIKLELFQLEIKVKKIERFTLTKYKGSRSETKALL